MISLSLWCSILQAGAAVGGVLSEALPYWLDLWAAASLTLSAVCTAALPWCQNLVYLGITLSCVGFTKGILTIGKNLTRNTKDWLCLHLSIKFRFFPDFNGRKVLKENLCLRLLPYVFINLENDPAGERDFNFSAVLATVLQIWISKHFNVLVLILYAAYAFGAAPTAYVAYLFSSGFFADLEVSQNGHHANNSLSENGNYDNGKENSTSTVEADSVLDWIPTSMYPFDIAALLSFLGGAVFLVLFGSSVIASPRMPKAIKKTIWKARLENMKPSKWFKAKVKLGPRTVLYLLAFFFLPLTMEICYGRFLSVYAEMTSLGFGKDLSAFVQVLFWGSVLLGRLFTPLTARCAAPNGLTVTCLTTGLISTAIIIAYGEKFPIFFWIFSAVTGFFIGPLVPLGLTWCNVYLNPSAMGLVLPMVLVGAAEAIFSWLMGYILHIYGPRGLLLYSLGASGLAFLLYLPIIPLLAKKSKWQVKKRKVMGWVFSKYHREVPKTEGDENEIDL